MIRKHSKLISIAIFFFLISFSVIAGSTAEQEEFVFGLIMFGALNDQGWNQSHYEAGLYVEELIPGTRMIPIEKMNPAERPGLTMQKLVNDLVSKGTKLIFTTSDYMAPGIRKSALLHPQIYFIQIPGDEALKEESPENLSKPVQRQITAYLKL